MIHILSSYALLSEATRSARLFKNEECGSRDLSTRLKSLVSVGAGGVDDAQTCFRNVDQGGCALASMWWVFCGVLGGARALLRGLQAKLALDSSSSPKMKPEIQIQIQFITESEATDTDTVRYPKRSCRYRH